MNNKPAISPLTYLLSTILMFSLCYTEAKANKIIARVENSTLTTTNTDEILALISEKKIEGVFFSGNWNPERLFYIANQVKQASIHDIEVWADYPSHIPHSLSKSYIPFPSLSLVKALNDTSLQKKLVTQASAYTQSLGADIVVVPHFDNISFINSDNTYSGNVALNGIYKLNHRNLEKIEGNWKEMLLEFSGGSRTGQTLIIPIDSLLQSEFFSQENKLNARSDMLIEMDNLPSVPPDLTKATAIAYEKSIQVLKNDKGLVPIQSLKNTDFHAVYLGMQKQVALEAMFNRYHSFQHYYLGNDRRNREEKSANSSVTQIILVEGETLQKDAQLDLLEKLGKQNKNVNSIVVLLGGSTSLKLALEKAASTLLYIESPNFYSKTLIPQVIFGGIDVETKFGTVKANRLGYSFPERAGLSSEKLKKIETIANEAIANDATPGCQVLVAKDGKVVYHKSFGYHSYGGQIPVTENSLYDLASLTKVLATLPTIMYLEENNKISLEETVATYLKEAQNTNKGSMVLKDILTHQAGLMSYIPHWYQLMENRDFDTTMVAFEQSEAFPIEVVPGLYAVRDIEEKIWDWTLNSRLTIRKKRHGMHRYFYSDLGFYIFHRLVERVINMPLENFTDEYYYKSLGLKTMTFLPLKKFPLNQIAPTEMDIYFRKGLVHGTVHDPGAAMKGGVSGHAGLFSNALDVAKLMQLFMQEGKYGYQDYLKPSTLAKFNSRPYKFYKNRRAIGWDKPYLDGVGGATSTYCSQATFGHTGFTGTATWADPEHNLVYVFLSNRIHPFAGNKKLIKENYRRRIHDVVYQALIEENAQ